MANDQTGFFNWYKRYKVRAQDMNEFQTAMVETSRGLGEGTLGAAVLSGFGVTPNGGLSVLVSPGIASAASGYLEVIKDSINLDVTSSSDTSLPCRSLIVVSPLLVDSNQINSPTSPFTSVPLKTLQEATISLIAGTPSSAPDYPSVGPNDVILCGLIVPPGTNTISLAMFDFEVRDSIGKNSLIAQNQVRFDNRLRPYRSAPGILGIKPSQNIGSAPLAFSYPGRLTPSLYPLNAGSFSPTDSFVDFHTGVISGGDTTTPTFAPVAPLANGSVVAVVTLTQADTLHVTYGNANGTYAQCLASIQNQSFSGPGSLPAPDGNFGIAYVIITSQGGTVSDCQIFDGRPFLGSGAAAAKFKNEVPSGTLNGTNNLFTLSTTPADPASVILTIDGVQLENAIDFTVNGTLVTITNSGFIPQASQSIFVKYLIYGAVSNNSSSGVQAAKFKQETPVGTIDGTNTTFTLSSVPVDSDSLDVWVDGVHLKNTDWTLTGNVLQILSSDFVPIPSQEIYVKYLYLGFISGGSGGGGGTSGFAPFGSKASPIVINPTSGLMATTDPLQAWFVKSSSGAVTVTATPQITPGSAVGQVLKIKAVDGTNFPVFQDGNGLQLNGTWPATGQSPSDLVGSSIELSWDGTEWSEDTRR